MSQVLPELPRPPRPETWRERLAGLAESLDLTPARLAGGLVALAVVGFVGWRLLAPPPPPPEMELPFASSTSVPAAAGSAAGASPSPSSSSVPDSGTVVVHVAGAVVSAGVEELPAGSRVVDGVDAAGGALPEADLAKVNLAAPLEDGQQVYVPRLGEVVGGAVAGGGGGAGGGGAGADGDSEIVDLNTADVDQLDALPGVGPAIAQAIVDHRESNGPFTSVDDLLDVRGIGEAKLADLRDRVAV